MLAGGTLELLPIESVELDKENPRIARFLEMYPDVDAITPEQIALALGADAPEEEGATGPTFYKLKESVRRCGTIIQPIVVRKTEDGHLVCLDGNTRLALYRDFKKNKVKGRWDQIPAYVYPALDDEDMDAVRLQAHLVGPRPWDPYSKAKYLNDLHNAERFSLDTLAEYCGGSKKMVVELIEAFADMENHYRPLVDSDPELQFEIRRFSSFVELQKPGVKEALVSSGHTIGEFAKWVLERKLPKNADVRLLPRILRSPRAIEVFLRSGAAEAEKTLDRPDQGKILRDASLLDLCRALRQACDQILHQEVLRLASDPSVPEVGALTDVHEAVRGLLRDISVEPD